MKRPEPRKAGLRRGTIDDVAELVGRLEKLHSQTLRTPLFNPVFQLGFELSRQLEHGSLGLKAFSICIELLEAKGLDQRALRLRKLIGPLDRPMSSISTPLATEVAPLTLVFTAHPTFLLNAAEAHVVIECLHGAKSARRTPSDESELIISLEEEHRQALNAMTQASNARLQIMAAHYDKLICDQPEQWRRLMELPIQYATWVGYDMDGRTDIGWATSILHRLVEKRHKLEQYLEGLNGIEAADQMSRKLDIELAHVSEAIRLFSRRDEDCGWLSAAANHLTANRDALVSVSGIADCLEDLAQEAAPEIAKRLLLVASTMASDGLGMGQIHFRLNASQVKNAVRQWIDEKAVLDLSSRAALLRVRRALAEAKPQMVNFAALEVEPTTAIRQFLAIAQILKHIDADSPVRLLIAECEEPVVVLAALFLARTFGVDDKLDISPLFETEQAFEHGARFLDTILAEPDYQAYARKRGQIAIQTGYSDAGRFMGQLPASLAIERLQGQLAANMERHGLTDVSALIFNTHGESMGRGAHPGSMKDRLSYPMSEWARHEFARRGIPLKIEVSFQGGDGYLFFADQSTALATQLAMLEANHGHISHSDPFYRETDLSLDFYRSIRRVQRGHLESRSYARTITAFGLGLLRSTGSRKSRRQSDLAAEGDMSLRQIRAIPHNAVLQQLGYPVNVLAGVGTAAGKNHEALVELFRDSPRAQQLLRMIDAADELASIKTFAAYGELFNPAFWASRTYRGNEDHLESACLALAELFTTDDRHSAFRTMASRLRIDGVRLHRLMTDLRGKATCPGSEQVRRNLGVLHALRLALLQHIFIRIIEVPPFSRANDVSRDEVVQMVLSLRIDEAVGLLSRAFPLMVPTASDYAVNERTDYPKGGAQPYAAIHLNHIQPILDAHNLILRISTVIANHFGAHG